MSQAIALMPALNGYGTLKEESSAGASDAVDTAAETFITDGLAKVMKINNICDSEHLEDCGIPTGFTNLVGSQIASFPTKLSEFNSRFTSNYVDGDGSSYINPQHNIDTKAAAFETQNGESLVLFYNPACISDLGEKANVYTQPMMCANFIYDLNGLKGPNTVGKDIGFITVLYPTDSVVVAPIPLLKNAGESIEQLNASAACTKQDPESRIPNKDELAAMFYNYELTGIKDYWFWSGSVTSSNTAWYQHFNTGYRHQINRSVRAAVRCVKR